MKRDKISLIFQVFSLFLILSSCVQAQDRKSVTVLNSKTIEKELHTWTLLSVEPCSDCTILEKMVMHISSDGGSWISSDKGAYIEDVSSGEKYFINDSEIGFDENKVRLGDLETRIIKEVYPPLPLNATKINVSTGSKYFVKDLDLSQSVYPAQPPMGGVSFFGLPLGMNHKAFIKGLSKQGFKKFSEKEDEDVITFEKILNTYFEGSIDDYPVTIKVTTSIKFDIVTEAEILYHNHVDFYELNEHLQEIIDEIKAKYPFREFTERKIPYQNATSILEMKSGKDKVFYNTTMKEFDGYYRIFESSTAEKYEYIGVVSVDVHKDLLNDDHVISIRYSDRNIADYIRRSIGKFRW